MCVCVCVCVWTLEPRCHSVMNASEQTFTTPNYPHNYFSNYVCQWVIRAAPGMILSHLFTICLLQCFPSSRPFWATVCKKVRPMLSVRCLSVCLSCLSVTFVHCGQTVGRIKMKLGMQVRLGPGPSVLDGDPAPPPRPKEHSPPIFGPYQLRPNGCMDQEVTWYRARPRPRRLCVRWGPRFPPQKGTEPPNFWPTFLVVKRLDG